MTAETEPTRSDRMDDPVWDYVLGTRLGPYIPFARDFWGRIEEVPVRSTGVFPVTAEGAPPGLMYRVTNTPVRSPVKGVQVFPFVPVSYLQITGVPGGVTRMVARVCRGGRMRLEEFTAVEKSNLPSTYHRGQFVALIPTDILNNTGSLGKWVYLTRSELTDLSAGIVPDSVRYKTVRYVRPS